MKSCISGGNSGASAKIADIHSVCIYCFCAFVFHICLYINGCKVFFVISVLSLNAVVRSISVYSTQPLVALSRNCTILLNP